MDTTDMPYHRFAMCDGRFLRPDTRKHAVVLAAVKDKPSAALKKRRP
jgi:hypothetical protein